MGPQTRRQLVIRAAGALAGAAVVPAQALADAGGPPPSDAELMSMLVGVERQVLFVYGRALASGALHGRTLAIVRQLAEHEQAHIAALERELPALGAAAPAGPSTVTAANAALATHHMTVDLGRPRSEKGWVKLLADVEDVLERNYHLAISELRHPRLLRLCAQIIASEAQHSALLGMLRQPHDIRKALPNPFVNGD